MPYINIKLLDDQMSKEKKLELIKATTQVMVDVLGKNPDSVYVVIDEVNPDNWGRDGDSMTNYRKRK